MRDKNALTDKELYNDTASIVENVKDTNISIRQVNSSIGFVVSKEDEPDSMCNTRQNITLGRIKGVEQFTLLNHELGHIMFDSPTTQAKDMLDKWTKHIIKHHKIWEKADEIDKALAQSRNSNVYEWYETFKRGVYSIYWKSLNIIEDQRIESQMAKLWLKNKSRFMKARVNVGKELSFTSEEDRSEFHKKYGVTPVECILAARFLRDDLAKQSPAYNKAKEILSKVEGTSQRGGMIGLKMYKGELDRYINAYLDHMLEKFKEIEELDEDDRYEACDECTDCIADEVDSLQQEHETDVLNTIGDDTKGYEQEEMGSMLWSEDEEEDDDDEEEEEDDDDENPLGIYEVGDSNSNESNEESSTTTEGNQSSSLETHIKEAQEEGKEEIVSIKKKMEDKDEAFSDDKTLKRGKRDVGGMPTPDIELAGNMNKLFSHLTDVPKKYIGLEGEEVDVESYIMNKTRGYNLGECMIDTKYVKGASILIAIDASHSMAGDKINTARDMCATLFKSIESIPNITLKCVVWSGNDNGRMLVQDINSISETPMISCQDSGSYYLTPTHLAIDYCSKVIQNMPGRNKLLIVITDGHPQHMVNGNAVPTNVIMNMCKRSMHKALQRCNNIIGMFVGSRYKGYTSVVEEIFGPSRSMSVESMSEGSDVISRKFKDMVVRTLK